MSRSLPFRLGKYELEEFLGGGMSHVYRARDTVIGRTVAIKVLTEQGCANEETKARFLQEARMAGNIEHENVINIYDFGEDDERHPFMVMEFLRGEDLRHAIQREHTGDLHNRLRIALQISRALAYIHTQNTVHRDIKPENIQITPAGLVKLMDFGIAKTDSFSMTRTGYVMGTPYYMAPEQVLGKDIGTGVDIYSFGILFFELLSGTKAITGDTVERIFYCILNEPLDLAPLKRKGVPPEICNLIARCAAKDRMHRPPRFEVITKELEGLITAESQAVPPAPTLEPHEQAVEAEPSGTKPWQWIALAAILAVALGVIALIFVNRGHKAIAKRADAPIAVPADTINTPTGEMALIPAGNFRFGKNLESISLPAYYMDRTEVSNSAYGSFCQATGHKLPDRFSTAKPDLPVVEITIDDARQFAKWAGKRLPSSQEWEKAARGLDGFPFPWGTDQDASRANIKDNPQLSKHELVPVRSFDKGASPFHVLQMVGNVWEFAEGAVTPDPRVVASFAKTMHPPPGPSDSWYQIRGESFQEPLAAEVMYDASTVPVSWKDGATGFRCVQDIAAKH